MTEYEEWTATGSTVALDDLVLIIAGVINVGDLDARSQRQERILVIERNSHV